MAFMCADSGNLMAIAQQVIQQQQQQQQQQRQPAPAPPQGAPHQIAGSLPFGASPWPPSAAGGGGGGDHFPSFAAAAAFSDAFAAAAADAVFSDPAAAFASAADFDSDEWMESLIGDSPVFPDSELDRLIFPTASPTPPPEPAPLYPPQHKSEALVAAAPPATFSPPLLQSLLACARDPAADPALAAAELAKIRPATSATGGPAERVAFYFAEALSERLAASAPPPPQAADARFVSDELTLCYKTLNDACPYSKFAHLTANQAILEATAPASLIHVVDFGIVQGIQWAALLQALATRPQGKPARIRISGIPSPFLGPNPAASLAATGARLRDFADLLGLDFEFVPVLRPVHELAVSDFPVEPDEAVAVNFMLQLHHLLADSPEPVRRVLRLAKSLSPVVVTLGEYEVSLNRAGFVDRFANALVYYRAVFESLEPAMARDTPERERVERCVFGERIRRAVGPGEGADRAGRMEGSGEWRAAMEWCGFEPVRLSNYARSQAELLIWDYDSKFKYSLVELPQAFLSLAWEKRPLLTVSAWR